MINAYLGCDISYIIRTLEFDAISTSSPISSDWLCKIWGNSGCNSIEY